MLSIVISVASLSGYFLFSSCAIFSNRSVEDELEQPASPAYNAMDNIDVILFIGTLMKVCADEVSILFYKTMYKLFFI